MVVYTGAETKLSLNSKRTPSKLSSVDKIVNHTMVVAIAAMVLVCIVSMGFNIMWLQQERDSDYLCLKSSNLDDRYEHGGGCESGSTSAFLTIFTFATLYNNFVCISMYVSLEMVYLWQSYYLCNDLRLYDPSSGELYHAILYYMPCHTMQLDRPRCPSPNLFAHSSLSLSLFLHLYLSIILLLDTIFLYLSYYY